MNSSSAVDIKPKLISVNVDELIVDHPFYQALQIMPDSIYCDAFAECNHLYDRPFVIRTGKYYSLLSSGEEVEVAKKHGLKEIDVFVIPTFKKSDLVKIIRFKSYNRKKSTRNIVSTALFLDDFFEQPEGKEWKYLLGGDKKSRWAKMIGYGETKIQKCMTIYNFCPELIDRIDDNSITEDEAYELALAKKRKQNSTQKLTDLAAPVISSSDESEPGPELNRQVTSSQKNVETEPNSFQKKGFLTPPEVVSQKTYLAFEIEGRKIDLTINGEKFTGPIRTERSKNIDEYFISYSPGCYISLSKKNIPELLGLISKGHK